MRRISEEIETSIADDLPVLIEGESGTGKETIARFLHGRSERREKPFLKLNCSASPVGLLETIIYGKDRGADADLSESSMDAIALAGGGTLFFDEIGDLSTPLQEKLFDTIKAGHFWSGNEEWGIDARFVCASSASFQLLFQSHQFLAGLLKSRGYHHLRLLPLRERKADIPALCDYLLERFAREFGRGVPRLSAGALEAFQQWRWPGNIRELENWIARIVIFGDEEAIGLQFSRQLVTWREPDSGRHVPGREVGSGKRLRRHR
jgi:two-component system response regulator HydG